MSKYIFVTGGVVSSLGKGITSASLGRLLKERGIRCTVQKLDPYINVDPGTMNPAQHGEVFVTKDGCETDLDISLSPIWSLMLKESDRVFKMLSQNSFIHAFPESQHGLFPERFFPHYSLQLTAMLL